MSDELKPCPFCGRENLTTHREIKADPMDILYIECVDCGSRGPGVGILSYVPFDNIKLITIRCWNDRKPILDRAAGAISPGDRGGGDAGHKVIIES